MRQFALINSVGESYELNDLSNFFHDPNGLGFTRKADYLKIGDHYQILTDGYDQAVLTGYICFSDEKNSPAYAKYAKFAQFIQNIPLILVYRSDKNHQIEVVPEMITKTEISKPLGLDVAVTFKALTLWYDEVEKSGTTSVQILSDSKLEGPCRIEITGPVNNPIWTHTVNGTQVATGKVTANIASGSILNIRTDTDPYEIYKVTSGVKTSLYANSDFSTQRFIYLQNGVNVISCTGAAAIKVTGRILHATV